MDNLKEFPISFHLGQMCKWQIQSWSQRIWFWIVTNEKVGKFKRFLFCPELPKKLKQSSGNKKISKQEKKSTPLRKNTHRLTKNKQFDFLHQAPWWRKYVLKKREKRRNQLQEQWNLVFQQQQSFFVFHLNQQLDFEGRNKSEINKIKKANLVPKSDIFPLIGDFSERETINTFSVFKSRWMILFACKNCIPLAQSNAIIFLMLAFKFLFFNCDVNDPYLHHSRRM